MNLTPAMERYVLHWGEMGTRWGVNRSVAQIHALLYLAPGPLPAEEIAETLGIARSNVSNSLKELQSWDLVKVNHMLGDRRDHFTSIKDTWEILNRVVEGRKRREIDPTLTMLRDCLIEAETDGKTDPDARARIAEMLHFVEDLSAWYEQVRRLPQPTLRKIIKLGARIAQAVKR